MIPQPVVEAHGVRLRPFRVDDTADVVDGCADPLSQRFVSTMPAPYTEADARWWIDAGAPAVWTGVARRTPSRTRPPTGCSARWG
ncbi:hypothetical protein GCM10027614_36550 [Micromonospora vulcania]